MWGQLFRPLWVGAVVVVQAAWPRGLSSAGHALPAPRGEGPATWHMYVLHVCLGMEQKTKTPPDYVCSVCNRFKACFRL